MELLAVRFVNSTLVEKDDVASWEASLNKPLDLKHTPKIVQHSAVPSYRIVTVVVSDLLTSQ